MKPENASVDTNVFIRLFTQDDPAQTKAALALFQAALAGRYHFFVNDLILSEIAWVLRKAYRLSPQQVRQYLLATVQMPFIKVLPADLSLRITSALDLFVKTNIDFTDAYIARWMQHHNLSIIFTFNHKHFSRVDGLDVRMPTAKGD